MMLWQSEQKENLCHGELAIVLQMRVSCCAGDRDDVVKFWDLRMAAQPAARLWPGVRA